MNAPPESLAGTLRAWGIAVLVVGLTAAALIAAFAPGATPDDLANRVAQGRMYRHNLELMGGTTGVLIDEFDRWFAALWHGRALAATIAVLAIAVALVCFVAARLARTAQSDPRQPAAKTDQP